MGDLIQLPRKIKLRGKWETREVWLNGRRLSPGRSQKVWNHSPDGFNWSYGGSGPAQLALAVLLEYFDQDKAVQLHQHFKRDFVAGFPAGDFDTIIDLDAWLEYIESGEWRTSK